MRLNVDIVFSNYQLREEGKVLEKLYYKNEIRRRNAGVQEG